MLAGILGRVRNTPLKYDSYYRVPELQGRIKNPVEHL